MTRNSKIILGIILTSLFILSGSIFIVEQKDQAIVLQFGEFKDAKTEPGLYFKLPFFMQEIITYDKRLLEINLEPKTLPDVNQKQIIIDAFVKYTISDPIKFYRTVKNYQGLYREVDSILKDSLTSTMGKIPFQDLLSNKRTEVMANIRNTVISKAEEFGVDIADLRIKRADLPTQNINSIFERMIAEREKEAKEFRAQGEEQSRIIKATAEKEKTIILAEANKRSEILRGEGDAEATRIFAESFGKDVDFFAFYRTMQAYKESIKSKDTSLILSPDMEFFKYIENYGK